MLERASANVQVQLFADILFNIKDCIIILDEEFTISYWNQDACNILALGPDVIGKSIFTVFDWPELPAILHHPEIEYQEIIKEIKNANNEVRSFRVLIYSISDSPGSKKHIIINLCDISEIIDAKSREKVANLAKSEFLANLSHEIRTPLVGILGFCELLNKSKLEAEETEYVETIEFCALQLMGIVNRVLNLSKIETGEIEVELKPFNLHKMVAKTINTLKPAMEKKGLSYLEEISPNIPPVLLGDEVKIQQVLTNLITNAIKYTKRGYIKVSLEVDVGRPSTPGFVDIKISVHDSGDGIELKQLDHIFEPFVQLNKTEEYSGVGLGLAISKKLVEAMGGGIWYEANEEQGSIFSFSLSLAIPEINSLGSPVTHDKPKEEKNGRVLLVEDIAVNRKLVSLMLKNMGYEVIEAANGQECLLELDKFSPDIIVMDMQMPILDGYEATKQIRNHAKFEHIPIIALTAYAMTSDVEKCLEAGCDYYLSKPFTQAQLAEVLDNCQAQSS